MQLPPRGGAVGENDGFEEFSSDIDTIETGITPTGKITITENGTDIDVSEYATADVDVAQDFIVEAQYNTIAGGTVLVSTSVEIIGDVIATIPDGVTDITNHAFTGNGYVTELIMPNSVNTILDGDYDDRGQSYGAFSSMTALHTINWSTNISSIGKNSFVNCNNLQSIIFPSNVTSIGESAFYACSQLQTIYLPRSLEIINYNAFQKCTSLTDIYYTGTQAEWEQITIRQGAIPEGVTIHYEYVPN